MRLIWTLNGAEIKLDKITTQDALLTDIIVSLFTDRRALDSDELPAGEEADRRGWWGDSFSERPTGSRLWLLEREKQLPDVLERCETYADESLQWLVELKRLKAVNCSAVRAENNMLLLNITIKLNNDNVDLYEFKTDLNRV